MIMHDEQPAIILRQRQADDDASTVERVLWAGDSEATCHFLLLESNLSFCWSWWGGLGSEPRSLTQRRSSSERASQPAVIRWAQTNASTCLVLFVWTPSKKTIKKGRKDLSETFWPFAMRSRLQHAHLVL
jgi:hypothetical protein